MRDWLVKMSGWWPTGWSGRQRGVILLLCGVLVVVLAVQIGSKPAYVPDPQAEWPMRAGALEDRIDPNVATWEELAALPAIGESRARDIVAYREQYIREGRGAVVFEKAEDLMRIKGVGYAMMKALSPYLKFPAAGATTQR